MAYFKERCRKHAPLTEKNIVSVMTTEWDKTTSEQLYIYYKHCGLARSSSTYADCTQPNLHDHA